MDILLMVNYVNIIIWDILSVIYHGILLMVAYCNRMIFCVHITGLVVNRGISNTIVLEIP